MRSRAAKLTLSALVSAALAAAAFFVVETEQQILGRRAAALRFDERVRAIDRALAGVRAGQQAYIAAGQNPEAWIPRVATLSGEAAQAIDDLRAIAETPDARTSLMEAAATIIDIGQVDRRAVGYIKSGQEVMAADVVYSEGSQTVAQAANQVDAARALEQQGLDVAERESRRRQAYVAGAAGLLSMGTLLLFAVAPPKVVETVREERVEAPTAPAADQEEWAIRIQNDVPRHSAPTMIAAADICTELGRVNEQADLIKLLGRAAELMDASGIVIWMGNPAGGDLRPALTYGYPPQTVARMPAVPRNAGNAAAAAYRSAALQIVLTRPGASSGALVAPLLTPDGCIGALSAEIRGRGETSDTTQALVVLFAAQLASVLAPLSAMPVETPVDKIASA
jgi:hypothetical protein